MTAAGDAGTGALGTASPRRTGRRRAGAHRRIRLPRGCSPRCIISARWICRRSISTSARTGSIATPPDDPARRAARTVMDRTFDCLARWLAPILCFTAEEAWLARHGEAPDRSIHLELFPEVPAGVARPGTRGALGRTARSAARRDRRAGSRARREAHRVEPAGGGRYLSSPDGCSPRCAASISPSCASRRPERSRAGTPPEDAFTLPDVPGIGGRRGARRRASAASAAGGSCRKSGMCRGMTICASAAPMCSTAAAAARGGSRMTGPVNDARRSPR